MEKVGMFKEPSEEWKKSGLNNEYFTKSQRFWGRTIKNKMLLSEGKIMKEQKKATTAIIAAVAVTTSILIAVIYRATDRL